MRLNTGSAGTKLAIAAALTCALAAPVSDAIAGSPKTVQIKGSSSGSFIRAWFRFESPGYALTSMFTGNNNLGGPFNGQNVTQYHFTNFRLGSCMYADGVQGYAFELVPVTGDIAIANGVLNYNQGQLFLRSTSSEGCMALAGLYWVNVDYDIVGGTGKFAAAAGTLHSTIQGAVLAAPSGDGSLGQFGAFQEQHTGTATY